VSDGDVAAHPAATASLGSEARYVDPQVRVYGEVAVMLTGWRQEAKMDGKDWSGDFRITDTWVWRDGRWQVVLRHSTHYR
jgi:ketosteroid isomerase-like protein